MRIVIPTHRRMPRLATLKNLPQSWMNRTILVVDEHDYGLRNLYDTRGADFAVVPETIRTIAAKRRWIIDNFEGTILMLDDDLRFAVRIAANATKLRQATSEDLEYHLQCTEEALETEDFIHVGWSARQGNNNVDEGGWHSNVRMMYSLGYDCDALRKLHDSRHIELGRIETREDMDLTLQLLRIGMPNRVCFDVACDQVTGFGAAGGCSEQRTLEASNADAHKLAELHPGLVKVVRKKYEGSPDREEVVVQWKKAFESSKVAR